MNKKRKASDLAAISLFLASMLVLHLLTSYVFNLLPLPIKPTLIHIPVIIASITYGPKIGATLGTFMGIISVVTNTIIILPTSYLFSPFVPNGNFNSLIIALVPRILIGITPYLAYKFVKGKAGLILAGAIGSATNTIFVLGGIFLLFSNVYQGSVQALLATVLTGNSIAELIISAVLTVTIVPRLLPLSRK